MGSFQYKTASSGSLVDVPRYAYHGTLDGTLEVIYPEAKDKDGNGLPCGAVGSRHILLKSTIMTASGMDFWQTKFSDQYAEYAEFWLTAKNPRTNNWGEYTGWLLRPTYDRVQIGTGSLSTLYSNIEIIVDLISGS